MEKNIVFIGLTGCGKSTIGKILAKDLGKRFIDMDLYIEEKEGKTVSEIFAQHGEAYFRQAETLAAQQLSQTGGTVIATGGGIILNPENIAYLKQNGIILFLDRSPEAILKKIDLRNRPMLAENRDYLFELDRQRHALYERYADLRVEALPKISLTVEIVKKAILPLLSSK